MIFRLLRRFLRISSRVLGVLTDVCPLSHGQAKPRLSDAAGALGLAALTAAAGWVGWWFEAAVEGFWL